MTAPSSKPSRTRRTEGAAAGLPRILIVDGDRPAAGALASLLQSTGHGDTRVACTAVDAIALADAFLPTVVLVDLDRADFNGYEVARTLAQHPALQDLRIIALTQSSEHPGRELAREAGIERYLGKPVSSEELDKVFA